MSLTETNPLLTAGPAASLATARLTPPGCEPANYAGVNRLGSRTPGCPEIRAIRRSFRTYGRDGRDTLMPVGETTILDLLCERAGLQGDDAAVTFIDYEQDWNGVSESL